MSLPTSRISSKSLWAATSCLLFSGSIALAETDITLGGELGLSATFGLTKDDLELELSQSLKINLELSKSLDTGLRIGGDLTIANVDELEIDHFLETDPFGIQEKKLVKYTIAGEKGIRGKAYALSGGQAISHGSIVAIKINSDWLSSNSKSTKYDLHVMPLRAQNICKMAGTHATKMNGQSANGQVVPGFGASVLTTRIGNGLARGNNVFVEGLGATGNYMAPGVFAAKRFIYARSAFTQTQLVNAAAHTKGARVVINNGTAKAVFETRFPSTKIRPSMVQSAVLPGLVHVQTQSKSATVLFSPGPNELDGRKVNFAQVHVGPVMTVRTVYSEEKQAIGVVCLEHENRQGSSTNYYLNNVTQLLKVAGASVFIEGGFGTLTFSNKDQPGFVAPSKTWTDVVAFDDQEKLVVTAKSAGSILGTGLSGMIAAQPIEGVKHWSTIAAAKYDMEGLALAADLLIDPSGGERIDAWQMEATFEPLEGAEVRVGYDSADIWWLEADYSSPVFSLSYETGGPSLVTNKARPFWSTHGELNINDTSLSFDYDKSDKLGFTLSRDLGYGTLFASISSRDEDTDVVFGSTLEF